jgi:hypothetical protein
MPRGVFVPGITPIRGRFTLGYWLILRGYGDTGRTAL